MVAKTFVIAIDGPAASGKGTLSRRLAQEFGFKHLDTGLTYRAVGHAMLSGGHALDDEKTAANIAREIDFATLDRTLLSTHDIGEAASVVAVMSSVRTALVEAQRKFSKFPPGSVLDGRDIGTVVCPDADVKLYVTAIPHVRARRRFEEIVGRGKSPVFGDILKDIKNRDKRDMERKDSPLRQAKDAHLIDTSKMDIETAFQEALAIVKKARAV